MTAPALLNEGVWAIRTGLPLDAQEAKRWTPAP
ncbi:MAG: hypothetical protein JWM58_1465 [Rhizobium sp.]|nr:hypothetical protein [Rhizobium sp.]